MAFEYDLYYDFTNINYFMDFMNTIYLGFMRRGLSFRASMFDTRF